MIDDVRFGIQAVRVDPRIAPPSAYLGVLGMPGLTAYAGIVDVAKAKEGDVVFVSGAAGAVGSIARTHRFRVRLNLRRT
ncbi:hypothetical protein BKA25_004679 [Actinoalloteichus hymeniacidonis]|uniref:Uncharacterized protein n=1 Tax=Actinoalloteichus hymeniacidonis TaxID=340345 RepID=A0AAC9HMS9_9PSEU|nr:hypothetical protein TL08_03980 [Actinoalloteichus hymeniacidonis]MBB5910363.1 hypothetical protein [Actinoalloteichus hymeniacidonis]